MSVKVSNWVWHDTSTEDLKGSQMVVLLALADIANDDGEVVYVTKNAVDQKALARKARVSVASFRRLTQSLEEIGLLEVSRENQTSPNRYRVVMSAQNERLPVSGQIVENERSHRSPVSGHSSIDVINVTTRSEAAKRGTRIAEDFAVTAEMVAWARTHAPLVNGPQSTQRFKLYWETKTGANATKLDWVKTWQNWLLKDQQDVEARRGGSRPTKTSRAADVMEMGRALEAALPKQVSA